MALGASGSAGVSDVVEGHLSAESPVVGLAEAFGLPALAGNRAFVPAVGGAFLDSAVEVVWGADEDVSGLVVGLVSVLAAVGEFSGPAVVAQASVFAAVAL